MVPAIGLHGLLIVDYAGLLIPDDYALFLQVLEFRSLVSEFGHPLGMALLQAIPMSIRHSGRFGSWQRIGPAAANRAYILFGIAQLNIQLIYSFRLDHLWFGMGPAAFQPGS